MDQRQTQIRERAGLEESKLNQEFIEWLRKWGTPILLVAAVGAAGFVLYEKRKQAANDQLDRAFNELESARTGGNASPDTLTAIADAYENVGSVSLVARLEAADAYLAAVQIGVRPGGVVDQQTGEVKDPADLLSEEDRKTNVTRAAELYQRVHDASVGNPSLILINISALNGLAAAEECRGELDKAKSHYNKIIELTKDTTFVRQGDIAQERIDSLPSIQQVATLPLKSQLPELPEALRPAPPTPPAPAPSSDVPSGAAPATPAATDPQTPAVQPPTQPSGDPAAPAPQPAPADPATAPK